jgi:hypothetical protein
MAVLYTMTTIVLKQPAAQPSEQVHPALLCDPANTRSNSLSRTGFTPQLKLP